MQTYKINENQAGQRLDKFLRKCLPKAPGNLIYKMLRKKNITLNEKKVQGNEILQAGDKVQMFFGEETFKKFTQAEEGSRALSQYDKAYRELHGIQPIYESKHLLAVNKPAGILSQKAAPGDLSLNEWMIGYLLTNHSFVPKQLATFHPSVANRLDRNTSGLVLCGISLPGSQEISRQLREHTLRKFYRAIVAGSLTRTCLLEGYLVKDKEKNKVSIRSTPDSSGNGSLIRTIYRPIGTNGEITYLEVELLTGKSHQIRAHLSSIGHPIIGDGKYGKPSWNALFHEKYGVSGQLLHGYRVSFEESEGVLKELGGKSLTAPLPPVFKQLTEDYALGKD